MVRAAALTGGRRTGRTLPLKPQSWENKIGYGTTISWPEIPGEKTATGNVEMVRTAAALRRFLMWSVSLEGGNAKKYLDAVGFIPLPDFIRALSESQIKRIQ